MNLIWILTNNKDHTFDACARIWSHFVLAYLVGKDRIYFLNNKKKEYANKKKQINPTENDNIKKTCSEGHMARI